MIGQVATLLIIQAEYSLLLIAVVAFMLWYLIRAEEKQSRLPAKPVKDTKGGAKDDFCQH